MATWKVFLDMISERLVGTVLLSDITYSIVGSCNNTIALLVSGICDSVDLDVLEIDELENEPLEESFFFYLQQQRIWDCLSCRASRKRL